MSKGKAQNIGRVVLKQIQKMQVRKGAAKLLQSYSRFICELSVPLFQSESMVSSLKFSMNGVKLVRFDIETCSVALNLLLIQSDLRLQPFY